jgi:hypothetical protein
MGIALGNVQIANGTQPMADSTFALGEMVAVSSEGSAPVTQRSVSNPQNKRNAGRGENRGHANLNRGSYEALAELPLQGRGGRRDAQRAAKPGEARNRGSFEAVGNFCTFPDQAMSRTGNDGKSTMASNRRRTGTTGSSDPQNASRTRTGTQTQRDVSGNSTSATSNNHKPVLTNANRGNQKPVAANASTGTGNGNNNAIAPSAADIAKDRSTMLSSVDKLLDGALGAGKYSKPTDHRGYTTLVNKAMKTLRTPAEKTAFQCGIEAAGKPFRLNFGLSKQVNGKAVALNADNVGTMAQGYQAERGKFYQEFMGKTNAKGVATKNNTRPVSNQTQNNNHSVASNRATTIPRHVVQNPMSANTRSVVPMNHTPANNTRQLVPMNHTPANTRNTLPNQAPSVTPTNVPSIYNPRSFLIA